MAGKKPTHRKRSASKSPPKKKKRSRRAHSHELLGILLLFLAAAVFLSLVSYHASDPSWASASSEQARVHNYLGRFGASVSEALLQLFGFTAFLLPLGLAYLGVRMILSREESRSLARIGGLVLLFLLLCPFMHFLSPIISWRGTEI